MGGGAFFSTHSATKETTHRQSSRWNKHETRMDFSSCHKQRSRPPCDVSDADNLIALYNASWRHIILTYIFLLSSAPDLLSSMLSPAPSPPVRLQRQWEVACSCGPGAPAHIWSSGKKKKHFVLMLLYTPRWCRSTSDHAGNLRKLSPPLSSTGFTCSTRSNLFLIIIFIFFTKIKRY